MYHWIDKSVSRSYNDAVSFCRTKFGSVLSPYNTEEEVESINRIVKAMKRHNFGKKYVEVFKSK